MRQKILKQVGVLLTVSILLTFLVVSLTMYSKFNGYMHDSVREEAEYKGGISIPGDKEGVNILTMHKSKGLEWKSVIIGSLSDDLCSEKRILQEYFSVNAISDPKDEEGREIGRASCRERV